MNTEFNCMFHLVCFDRYTKQKFNFDELNDEDEVNFEYPLNEMRELLDLHSKFDGRYEFDEIHTQKLLRLISLDRACPLDYYIWIEMSILIEVDGYRFEENIIITTEDYSDDEFMVVQIEDPIILSNIPKSVYDEVIEKEKNVFDRIFTNIEKHGILDLN